MTAAAAARFPDASFPGSSSAYDRAATRGRLARLALLLDSAVSAVPVLGNLADVFWRANRRNMAILARHLDGAAASARGPGAAR